MKAAALALVLVGANGACVPDNGPLMRPGEDCMACHGGTGELRPGEERKHAVAWTVAGTVFENPADAGLGAEGVQVQITDSNGWRFSLRSNEAGNFYSREPVVGPLRSCVTRGSATRCMEAASTGACNACHTNAFLGPSTTAPLSAP